MSEHIFLAPESVAHVRWREAFPDARIFHGTRGLPAMTSGDVVWVAAELPRWRSVVTERRRSSPACAIVLLSLQPDQNEGLTGLELGARGYCHALAVPSLLREVAAVVTHGGLWVGPDLMQRLLSSLTGRFGAGDRHASDAFSALSEREAEVARRVAAGRTNKEVARALDITERTVKAHLSAVFDKLGVRDRLQLVLRYGRAEQAEAALR